MLLPFKITNKRLERVLPFWQPTLQQVSEDKLGISGRCAVKDVEHLMDISVSFFHELLDTSTNVHGVLCVTFLFEYIRISYIIDSYYLTKHDRFGYIVYTCSALITLIGFVS